MLRFALLPLLLLPLPTLAATVPHRGFQVEARGNATSCLSCHNGTKASPVTSCGRDMCRIYGNHLVQVPYPPRGKEHLYAPTEEIEIRGLLLDNGIVTCYTCHDLRRKEQKAMLVIPYEREEICRACHLM